MKRLNYFLLIVLVFSATPMFAQIKMNSGGYVNIGPGTPGTTYTLSTTSISTTSLSTNSVSATGTLTFQGYSSSFLFDFYGYGDRIMRPTVNNHAALGSSSYGFNQIYSYSYVTLSDSRQKENIKPIEGSTGILMALKGVKYDLKKEIYQGGKRSAVEEQAIERDRKNKIGFLAQQVYEVLPEVVFHNDSTDIYAVDYSKIVPVLVEGFKEQQNIISQQSERLAELEEQLQSLKRNGVTDNSTTNLNKPELMQNNPNPYNEKTEIGFRLPETTRDATIYIYNLQGIQIKSISVINRGSSSIVIQGGDLQAGIYIYTLIADNQVIGSKRMIITK